jgi:hypothetical protein
MKKSTAIVIRKVKPKKWSARKTLTWGRYADMRAVVAVMLEITKKTKESTVTFGQITNWITGKSKRRKYVGSEDVKYIFELYTLREIQQTLLVCLPYLRESGVLKVEMGKIGLLYSICMDTLNPEYWFPEKLPTKPKLSVLVLEKELLAN